MSTSNPSKNARTTATSTVSQSSLFSLKSILSEHKDKFSKEGREAVRGDVSIGREQKRVSELSRDKFSRPSPNLTQRLARQSRLSASDDRTQRPSEAQRMEALKRKAEMYERLQRGDLDGVGEREMKEWTVDFERKWNERSDDEDGFSDHSSDVDESAVVHAPSHPAATSSNSVPIAGPSRARPPKSQITPQDAYDTFEDEYVKVEYVDEMGRTRVGTRKEAREAEQEKQKQRTGRETEGSADGARAQGPQSAHEEVLQSNVIYGAQSFFPVYEPTQEDLLARLQASSDPLATHYDSTREVRARGAGAYQFSLDEEERKAQMEALESERRETERRRKEEGVDGGEDNGEDNDKEKGKVLTKAEEGRKRKLNERRALIEAKRIKMMGGKEALETARKAAKSKQADAFLEDLEKELEKSESAGQGGP